MKHLIVAGFMSVTLMAMPALAAESDTFFAMKQVEGHEQSASSGVSGPGQLSDQELSTVEGGDDICAVCANVAAAVNAAVLNITDGNFTQVATTGSQSVQ